MNKNLVELNIIKNIIKNKGLDKYIKQIGYSNIKDKKYYVILKNEKIIHYGNINYQDYLIHQDDKRRDNFKKRFYKQYIKIKDNIESPLFWSYNILW